MNVLDLFSGIGGFSLGLERAGMRTVAFCEINPFCQRVLATHWPNVPCYDDIRTLTAERLAANAATGNIQIDVICGGFPCQDISHSKTGAEGISGKRSGLWREYARLIRDIRPSYAIVENVGALTFRGLEQVTADLAAIGYSAEWDVVSASRIGAPQARERLWLVAYPDGAGLEGLEPARSCLRVESEKAPAEFGNEIIYCGTNWPNISDYLRMGDGVPRPVDAIEALGNAVVPQIPEIIGRAILAAQNNSAIRKITS